METFTTSGSPVQMTDSCRIATPGSETVWMPALGRSIYETTTDEHGTWIRNTNPSWFGLGWWLERNVSTGNFRWRELLLDQFGEVRKPFETGKLVYEEPAVLKLQNRFAGRGVVLLIDRRGSTEPINCICKEVLNRPYGDKLYFGLEFDNGQLIEFEPKKISKHHAEGRIIKQRKAFLHMELLES